MSLNLTQLALIYPCLLPQCGLVTGCSIKASWMLGLKWIRPRTYLGSSSSSQFAKKETFQSSWLPLMQETPLKGFCNVPTPSPSWGSPARQIYNEHLAASCSSLLFPPSEMDKSLLLGLPVLLCCFRGERPCGWQWERCAQDVGMGPGSRDRGSLMRVMGNRSCHSNTITFTHNASHPWNLQQTLRLQKEIGRL